MGKVLQFSRSERAFDADTTAVLVAAYERVRAEIEIKGLPKVMSEVAARRIIALAAKGERDADRLSTAALATIAKAVTLPFERTIARLPAHAIDSMTS
jgi:hypothetical protein